MEDRVTAFARESFPQMSEEERREAIRSLRKLIDAEVFAMASGDAGGEPPEKCPRCGHWHVVKRGRTSGGAQRYLCRSCSHTFTESTLKVFATTKLERGTWMRYAECHVDLCTLRGVREKCGVSLKTAWFMRHRVLEAISASMPPFRSSAGDGMQVDETYLRESFKGNRKNAECGIPRKARRRHEGVDNYEQICVLTGVNDAGDMFFEMAGRGNITDDRATWMKFAECHVDVLSLRESAERCGVSLKTAFFMRHRVLECIAQNMPAFRSAAGDGMEVDECYLRESFKGNRKNATCGIPRRARHRSGPQDWRERICILTGINDAGDMFFEMTGRGNMSEEQAGRFLAGKVASGAIVSTDKANSYRRALRDLDVRRHDVSPSGAHGINVVNNLHSRLASFLDGFKGVATRRLWNYLAWFKWLWTFRVGRTAETVADMVVKHAGANTYRTTWRECKKTPYPFYDYWAKQAGWDATARAALPLAALRA